MDHAPSHAHAPHDDDDDGYNTPQTPPPLPLPLPLATAEKTTDTKPWVRASTSFAQMHFYCKRNQKLLRKPRSSLLFVSEEATIKRAEGHFELLRKPSSSRLPPGGWPRAVCARCAHTPQKGQDKKRRHHTFLLVFALGAALLPAWDIIQINYKRNPRQVTGGLMKKTAVFYSNRNSTIRNTPRKILAPARCLAKEEFAVAPLGFPPSWGKRSVHRKGTHVAPVHTAHVLDFALLPRVMQRATTAQQVRRRRTRLVPAAIGGAAHARPPRPDRDVRRGDRSAARRRRRARAAVIIVRTTVLGRGCAGHDDGQHAREPRRGCGGRYRRGRGVELHRTGARRMST